MKWPFFGKQFFSNKSKTKEPPKHTITSLEGRFTAEELATFERENAKRNARNGTQFEPPRRHLAEDCFVPSEFDCVQAERAGRAAARARRRERKWATNQRLRNLTRRRRCYLIVMIIIIIAFLISDIHQYLKGKVDFGTAIGCFTIFLSSQILFWTNIIRLDEIRSKRESVVQRPPQSKPNPEESKKPESSKIVRSEERDRLMHPHSFASAKR